MLPPGGEVDQSKHQHQHHLLHPKIGLPSALSPFLPCQLAAFVSPPARPRALHRERGLIGLTLCTQSGKANPACSVPPPPSQARPSASTSGSCYAAGGRANKLPNFRFRKVRIPSPFSLAGNHPLAATTQNLQRTSGLFSFLSRPSSPRQRRGPFGASCSRQYGGLLQALGPSGVWARKSTAATRRYAPYPATLRSFAASSKAGRHMGNGDSHRTRRQLVSSFPPPSSFTLSVRLRLPIRAPPCKYYKAISGLDLMMLLNIMVSNADWVFWMISRFVLSI